MRIVFAAILTLPTLACWAQPAEFLNGTLAPEVELPPRYRVEFIIFSHNRFNETEEYFDVVPPESQFAAKDEPMPMRFFDAEASQALRQQIEGPISASPLEAEPEDIASDAAVTDTELNEDPELVLEAYLDPRLVEGPNTRYLDLHELTLLPALDRLVRLDAYEPLVHAGWEQNGLPEADAVALSLEEFDTNNPRGTLRLHMSRYLHMAVDLAYEDEPLTPEAQPISEFDFGTPQRFGFSLFEPNVEPEEPEFYLFEQRRILRDELNYFDHPAFGLLLQITLAPEPEIESATEADGPSA